MAKTLWDNNEIQFARLLCELAANWEDDTWTRSLTIRAVARSMDLTPDHVNDLFDRANDVWERSKMAQRKLTRATDAAQTTQAWWKSVNGDEHMSSPNGCHPDCPACEIEEGK